MALRKGTVYLVGAGPGDHRLITIRGLSCIRNADVIVYDRLVNPVLLNYAHPSAEVIYAGKSPGNHAMRQEEINAILVQKATEGKSVVRLKGGDPFVFGRGGEEAEYLLENGINFEVVPGVSSATAVPAYAGIPVTHRDMSSGFAVLTGRSAEKNGALRWAQITAGCDTLIFLMGMETLSSIVNNLLENGRDPLEPVALIQWGTTPEQRCLIGNLSNIVGMAERANLTPPIVTVVGKVAELGKKLAWFGKKPLSGKRVMITRPRHQAQELAELIEDLGGEPLEFPTIDIAPPSSFSPIDSAIGRVEEYSWLVFTSVNGVSAFFDRMKHLRKDIRSMKGIHICAIGPKTKEKLEELGLIADYVPINYTLAALSDGLREVVNAGEKILVPRAESAPDVFGKLRDLGFDVCEVPAYKVVRKNGNVQLAKTLFYERKIHILFFFSSSTVTNFVDMMGISDLGQLLEGVMVGCIGPVTADTARNVGIPVHVVAKEYTAEGMIASLLDYMGIGGSEKCPFPLQGSDG